MVGLVVNPVAGMGGRVGLKGTDGADMLEEALRRGAEPVAPGCVLRFLDRLGERAMGVEWLTCSGDMGADLLAEAGLREGEHFRVAYRPPEDGASGPRDTRAACQAFLAVGTDLVVFCGGDGTARDVMAEIGDACPVMGVPAGVKMFSGVFAISPEAAGEVLAHYLDGASEEGEGEVADVDEGAYRRGELAVRLHGVMRILRAPTLIQSMKGVTHVASERAVQEAIAAYVVEMLEQEGGPVTILGAGSTVAAVARVLGVQKTPLGVDVVRGRELLVADGSEEDILRAVAGSGSARIVVSPIGSQGFVLGRGSQQISPEVIEAAGGPAALIIVATPHKLRGVTLRVDTGDPDLDGRIAGMRRVVSGFHDVSMVRVVAASAPDGG